MSVKTDILQIIFGALLLGVFIEVGILGSGQNFWTNVLSGIVVYVASRVLAWVFGGR